MEKSCLLLAYCLIKGNVRQIAKAAFSQTDSQTYPYFCGQSRKSLLNDFHNECVRGLSWKTVALRWDRQKTRPLAFQLVYEFVGCSVGPH